MSVSDAELINAFTKYMTIVRAGSSGQLYTDTVTDLQTKITDMNGQISILDGQEETYNQQYMDAKENPQQFGLFSGVGLRTTQDWVLAYFYFSYICFSILLFLTVMKNSENKGSAAFATFSILLLVGIMTTAFILAYA